VFTRAARWPPRPPRGRSRRRTPHGPGTGGAGSRAPAYVRETLELFFALSIALIYGTFENIHGTAARVAACLRAPRGPPRAPPARTPRRGPRGARPEDAVDCEFAEPT